MSRPHLGTIDEALGELRLGRLAVIPTETVYGLAGSANGPNVANELNRVKGQREGKPFPMLVSSTSMARQLTANWPDAATRLSEVLWPGALTIVLGAHPELDRALLGGGSTVGVRMPDHPVAREIIEKLEAPLASSSANRSGAAPPASASAAIEALAGEALIVVDGGTCSGGVASTVISLVDAQRPRILREGGVARERIEEVLSASLG